MHAKRTIAYATNAGNYGPRFTDPLPPPASGHETERMFGLAAPLGIALPDASPAPEFRPPPQWLDDAARWLGQAGFTAGNFVVLGLSARDPAKVPTKAQALHRVGEILDFALPMKTLDEDYVDDSRWA